MTAAIVSDAGPLISFARAGCLDLLRQVVEALRVPEAVYHEVVVKGKDRPGSDEVARGSWIVSQPLSDTRPVHQLPASLGRGEKEAIALCLELGASFLVDDPVARREARARGIALISSLDVLDEAKDRNLITDVKTTLNQFVQSGFRLKRTLYDAKLCAAGEQ